MTNGNEISVLGVFSNNGQNIATATFDSTDDFTYDLTLAASEFFVATYDIARNLLRITGNGDNEEAFISLYISGFVKGEGDSYYMSGSIRSEGVPCTHFGNTLSSTNDTDAFITRFNEQSGIQYMARTLDTNVPLFGSTARLHPNPGNGNFTVALGETVHTAHLEISDITGKQNFTADYNTVSEISANVAGATGIYFIKVIADEKVSCLKYIKK